MTCFNPYSNAIQFADTPNIDAFGRLRVSQVTTQYDAKQLYDNLPLFVDEVLNGGATATHSTTEAVTRLGTSSSGDYAILQTKQRFNYQSGKSQLIFMTFNGFGTEANVTKRIGYFSSSTTAPHTADFDGIFLQDDGTNLSLNIYKTGSASLSVNRSLWDDPLDGTGASGINHDFANNTILAIDFEWLGLGRVRFYLVTGGAFVQFHAKDFTNVTGGVYMSSPNQPLRWEMRQSGAGSGTMDVICSSVNSEGSINKLGKVLSANTGTSQINANSSGTTYAVIGIRLNTSRLGTLVDIVKGNLMATTNDDFRWEIYLNPTVAGTFTYNSVTNSSIQVATGATANTVSGGTLIDSGYELGDSKTNLVVENAIRLGATIAGVADTMVLCVTPLSNGLDIYGSLTWRELT